MANSIRWDKIMRWGVNLCRFLLACTFVLSGILKMIDPMGTQYKIEDYALAWGLSAYLPSLASLLLAIVLGFFEFDLGICLFFGVHRKRVARVCGLFMLGMTLFSVYLVWFNPVSDCGCFGEAWKLSPTETFWKNILLLCMSAVVLWRSQMLFSFVLDRQQWIITLYTKIFAFVFISLNLYGLPIIDFTPYHIGADILQKMALGESDSIGEDYYLMEKDGVQQQFTWGNYPDSTWTLVDVRSGGEVALPEITDFQMISTDDQQDITEEFLSKDTYKFLFIAPRLELADDGTMDRVAEIYDFCVAHDFPFYCLTASSDSVISKWSDYTGAEYPYCRTDEVVLRTMIRSNPGLILMKGSVIQNKWAYTSFPCLTNETYMPNQMENLVKSYELQRWKALRILLWYVCPLLFVTWICRRRNKYKLKELR